MHPVVTERPDGPGVRVVDPVEKSYEELHTPGPVDPARCSTGAFHFPVDLAVAVETPWVRTPYVVDVWVRTADGDLVADTANDGSLAVPARAYNVELSVAGVKLYLAVESGVEVRPVDQQTEVRFGGPTRVTVGARSFHERPAGTVTVTDDPADLMDALSLFGSALKTRSPERSFPTLRGHPPLIERGDAFEAPDGLDAPETGVRIEVPPEREAVFPVASLAYYLGATVAPAGEPRLVADGTVHDLDGAAGFEATVARVLRQTFLFDCVVRTEGYYTVDLRERRELEAALDRDLEFAALYDLPLAERVNRYLSVPYETVEEVVPTWRLTADVAPEPEYAPALPFVADKLAVVRCESSRPTATPEAQPAFLDDFYRAQGPGEEPRGLSPDGGTATGAGGAVEERVEVVHPAPTDSHEHVWFGDGVPLGANKASVEAFRRRVGRSPESTPTIEVDVVANDPGMDAERDVAEAYESREHVAVDVDSTRDATRSELRERFERGADFLHYIGHIDGRGLQCSDGYLDAGTIGAVNTDTFLLNGCRSFAQGQQLVAAGAVGGIVTLDYVHNSVATRIGRTISLLLNAGHSLGNAAGLVAEEVAGGLQYVIVGDGSVELIEPARKTPVVWDATPEGPGWETVIEAYPSNAADLGTLFTPYLGENDVRYLNTGRIGPIRVSSSQLRESLGRELLPVRYEGEFVGSKHFSDERLPR